MKKISIKEIDFNEKQDQFKTSSYPESGLYIVNKKLSISDSITDLIFVDKTVASSLLICPLSVAQNIIIEENDSIEVPQPKKLNGFVSEEFVLEFSKILLESK